MTLVDRLRQQAAFYRVYVFPDGQRLLSLSDDLQAAAAALEDAGKMREALAHIRDWQPEPCEASAIAALALPRSD